MPKPAAKKKVAAKPARQKAEPAKPAKKPSRRAAMPNVAIAAAQQAAGKSTANAIDAAKLEPHPLANLLPMMSEGELLALQEDIRSNKQREPIVLHEGKVLDGRNRLKAVLAIGAAPLFRTFDTGKEGTALSYIISKATHRHMDDSQKACAAVNILGELEAEAKTRMAAGGGSRRAGVEPVPYPAGKLVDGKSRPEWINAFLVTDPEERVRIWEAQGFTIDDSRGLVVFRCAEKLADKLFGTGAAREQAGQLFGVSGRYVQDAKLLKLNAPDLFAKAFNGELPLTRAKREWQRATKSAALAKKAKAVSALVRGPHNERFEVVTGDCVDYLAKTDRKFRLIFADPPYNLGFDYGNGARADALPEKQYADWCAEWLVLCEGCLAEDGSILVMIDAAHQSLFFGELLALGLHWRNTIVWHETFGSYADGNYTPCARFVHYFTRHPTRFTFNGDSIRVPSARQTTYGDSRADPAGKVPGNVWSEFPRLVDNAAERMPGFPTQVPAALMERIVLAHSDPGDEILDPFNGSGSTGRAAIKHGRRYLGIEKVERNAGFARASLITLCHEIDQANGGRKEAKAS